MGICFSVEKTDSQREKTKPKQNNIRSNIENVDVVKVKLKHARDRIKNFINMKKKDIDRITLEIKEKIPKYEQTGNKKPLVPLLQARVTLQKLVSEAQLKLKVINDSIDEVEMSKMNAQMVNVLDDSNKYIRQIQDQLEAKDWQNVLAEAQHKYEIQWPDDSQEIQQDPEFQAMWKEIGGDKIVQKKSVHVNVETTKQTQKQQQMQMA